MKVAMEVKGPGGTGSNLARNPARHYTVAVFDHKLLDVLRMDVGHVGGFP